MTDPAPPPTSPADDGDDAERPPPGPLPLGPIGRALAIVGPGFVVIAGFLEWLGRNYIESFGALDIPAKFVIDSEATPDKEGLSLGIVVLIVGIGGLVGALVPRVRILVWLGGATAVAIALLFAIQLNDLTERLNEAAVNAPQEFGPGGYGVRNTVGIGAALCGLGGVVTLVGGALGFVASRRPS